MSSTETDTEYPYRIADNKNQGWLGDGKGNYHGYDPTAGRENRPLESRPLDAIRSEFGPWRPVLPLRESDRNEMHAAFELAGRKTITSIASALEQVHHEARERFGPWSKDSRGTADYAQRTLTAGRPGSWEADAIMDVVWFGSELNLHPRKALFDVAVMRSTGPNPKRVHREARDHIAAVLRGWVASEDRYTEVAENLAHLVSWYADETYGDQGWKNLADQWLQPGSLATDNFRVCYRLLYSVSEHFNSDAI